MTFDWKSMEKHHHQQRQIIWKQTHTYEREKWSEFEILRTMWIYFESLVNSDIDATITMSVSIVWERERERVKGWDTDSDGGREKFYLWDYALPLNRFCDIATFAGLADAVSRHFHSRRTIMCFNGFAQSLVLNAAYAVIWCAPFHLISDCIEANSNGNRFMSKSVRIYLPIADSIFLCAAAADALLCCVWREIFFYYDSVLFHFNFPHDNIKAARHQNAK